MFGRVLADSGETTTGDLDDDATGPHADQGSVSTKGNALDRIRRTKIYILDR